jgi:hypothetical protein
MYIGIHRDDVTSFVTNKYENFSGFVARKKQSQTKPISTKYKTTLAAGTVSGWLFDNKRIRGFFLN